MATLSIKNKREQAEAARPRLQIEQRTRTGVCANFVAPATLSGGGRMSPQQIELIDEPRRLYRPDATRPARFALCTKNGSGRVDQQLFNVSQLEWVMRQVAQSSQATQRHVWISQATLHAGARNRRISSIYKGFPIKVKQISNRDASRSDGSRNAFRLT